jgi:type I restriction enzyme, R subunit
MMRHNEDSRVKIPALLHFLRLGYTYQTKKAVEIDPRNNIFVDIFRESIARINKAEVSDMRLNELLREIQELTSNTRDKGASFFRRLHETSSFRLIDFKNPDNNDFRVVTELPFFREGEVFRPDITVLVNGIPLGFLEVKKPNNSGGIQVEFRRHSDRARKEEFTAFFNQFQVLGFTNNLTYNDEEMVKMSGSFYMTPNGNRPVFNHFREEHDILLPIMISEEQIDNVLIDNRMASIRETNEFKRNLDSDSPCNQFITSVFSLHRLIFFIQYGIVYVDSLRDGLNKHIIRYPQYFAIHAMVEKLRKGMKRGVVWHTQGSGKTGLAYFATNVLRDLYQEKGILTKFYFVVDRLDLLLQASSEFSARGMTIANINNKEDFVANIKSPVIMATSSNHGMYKETMNVVNIQKFSDESVVDSTITKKIQRIYFLDEVHRSYRIRGQFLANLLGSDPNGIFIGLTGTPILKTDFKTTDLFSDYIHKYYYNKSIADGYTLKIKKENISTTFKSEVRGFFEMKEDEKISSSQWELVGKEPNFVDKVSKYIEEDFEIFRSEIYQDMSLGFMVVTSSSEQARLMQDWFRTNSTLKTALVLYDEEDTKTKQEEFRGKRVEGASSVESAYHGVLVYNMLLTGFDAPRLKRLYLLRRIREHSLLQTLARVNRPYKRMKYGYVVDFVDITEEYEETNRRYLEELREGIEDEDEDAIVDIDDMFVDVDKVKKQLRELNNRLFRYMGNIETNLEDFRDQVEVMEMDALRTLRQDLQAYRECYNELRIAREDVSHMPIDKVARAYQEVESRIRFKRDEERLEDEDSDVEEIDFSSLIIEFIKKGEIDLDFTTEDDVQEVVLKIQSALSSNLDKEDELFQTYKAEFKALMLSLKLDGRDSAKVKQIMDDFRALLKKIQRLNIDNHAIMAQYRGDDSCMRIHKQLVKHYSSVLDDTKAHVIMLNIIGEIDKLLGGFESSPEVMKRRLMRPVRDAFLQQGIRVGAGQVTEIVKLFTDDKYR